MSVQFTVRATSSGGALSYQWQDNRSGSFANCIDGSGATTDTYTVPTTTYSMRGRQYQVIVTDSNGSVTSRPATLIVNWQPSDVYLRSVPSDANIPDVRLYDPTQPDSTGGVTVNVTGSQITSASGSVSVTGDANVSPTGSQATFASGSVTIQAGASVSPTGSALAASVGSVSVTGTASVSVTGSQATFASGSASITADANVTLTGSQALFNSGSVTVTTGGDVVVNVTGSQIALTSGSVSVTGDAIVNLAGSEADFASGNVTVVTSSPDVTVNVTGSQLTTSSGSVSVEVPSGQTFGATNYSGKRKKLTKPEKEPDWTQAVARALEHELRLKALRRKAEADLAAAQELARREAQENTAKSQNKPSRSAQTTRNSGRIDTPEKFVARIRAYDAEIAKLREQEIGIRLRAIHAERIEAAKRQDEQDMQDILTILMLDEI